MNSAFCGTCIRPLSEAQLREREGYDPVEIANRVRRVFSGLEGEVVGYEDLLVQTMYALLTRENLLLISRPGTAKTLFAKLVFSRIHGARVFELQMSKGTLAEEVVGPVNIDEMKHGNIVHNVEGTLIDSDLAFIDEFFDANDMVLRSMLGIFNEGWFKKGKQRVEAALHTGIAAANYVRATEITAAVLDRFLFRAYVDPRFDPYSLQVIDETYGRHFGQADAHVPGDEQIPLPQLTFLADIVQGRSKRVAVTVPPHVLFLKNVAIKRYVAKANKQAADQEGREVYVSPRTFAKARMVLNASALLRGRLTIAPDDLHDLRYMVPMLDTGGCQAKLFEAAVDETLRDLGGDELRSVDELMEAHEVAEQVFERARSGRELPVTSFLQRLLMFFNLTTPGEVQFSHVTKLIERIRPRTTEVRELQAGMIGRIGQHQHRMDNRDRELLL